MITNEYYMKRCLELARLSAGATAPNPMVGCVIVHNGRIIGEGYHRHYGGPHAEVNAVNSVANPALLRESTLYVSLEPCAHHGLTPPCSELIVQKEIPHVVIGTVDPFAAVAGRGIERLRRAGIEVTTGILEAECRTLNRRFFTFHEKKRPYIILKWAQTIDGFIDIDRSSEAYGEPTWITGDLALRLVHKIRSEEGAILVGTRTAEKDNPSLTVRHWPGKQPLRLVIDRHCRLPQSLNLLDGSTPTLMLNALKNETNGNTEWVQLDFSRDILPQIMDLLCRRKILSLIVEGGKELLDSFVRAGLWDEAHIFIGNKLFHAGIRAPLINGKTMMSEQLDNDWLKVLSNPI